MAETALVDPPAGAARMDRLIDAMGPDRVPEAATVLQARRNAAARERFLAEHGAFEVGEAVRLAHYKTRNPSEQVGRWRREGRVFTLDYAGRSLLPAFQFSRESGQLLEATRSLLAIFEGRRRGWEIALWMAAPNGWLDGRTPLELWPEEADRVFEAARLEVAPLGT
jgi:hypothetical protein